MLIENLAIIGVGLIGGSLARALKRVDACGLITGYDRDRQELARAAELAVIDRAAGTAAQAVAKADLVVVAVPLGAVRKLFAEIAPHLRPHAVITDVGSVKACVIDDARATLGAHLPFFVPGHPVAGTEKSGVDASFAELFERHRIILTPVKETRADALEQVRQMWQLTGGIVETMDREAHDNVLAATSHLPHVLAYAFVHTLATMDSADDVLRLAAGGFADFTRIASSNPEMWRDIIAANPGAILAMVERFDENLALLAEAIKSNDKQRLVELLEIAKVARDGFWDKRRIAN